MKKWTCFSPLFSASFFVTTATNIAVHATPYQTDIYIKQVIISHCAVDFQSTAAFNKNAFIQKWNLLKHISVLVMRIIFTCSSQRLALVKERKTKKTVILCFEMCNQDIIYLKNHLAFRKEMSTAVKNKSSSKSSVSSVLSLGRTKQYLMEQKSIHPFSLPFILQSRVTEDLDTILRISGHKGHPRHPRWWTNPSQGTNTHSSEMPISLQGMSIGLWKETHRRKNMQTPCTRTRGEIWSPKPGGEVIITTPPCHRWAVVTF